MNNSLEHLAKHHYENFPVGSLFIPKKYRKPIHLIYSFARTADDIADEGLMSVSERIARLDEWQKLLENGLNGTSDNPFFIELASIIRLHKLSPELFTDLLIAFRRDSSNPTYNTIDEILEYCRYSANPIGRLLLQVFNCSNDETVRLSDKICTALQLTNFWQDISVDTSRNRFYIPKADLQEFNIVKENLLSGGNDSAFRALMKKQVNIAEAMFYEGKPLFLLVANDFRFELRMIWHGGMRILEKIKQQQFDTRTHRPKLNSIDFAKIFLRALFR